MYQNVFQALGGVGLFLVGMMMLTDGVRSLADTRLRDILRRFTATPLTGAITGAGTTALLQSSSATTVMAVGFVSAGVLSFPQALGVIFGANFGTTVTGWLVALLGFKLNLGQAVAPLILLGALLRLLTRGRLASLGGALAGFSLLFIGIEAMKDGMAAFQGLVTPTDFPPDTLGGRGQLVLAGVLITLVTQSSSAGVATALAALGAGAINFPQAAALVIGMDVGTTVTAVIATLGGATSTRRTGYAHTIYNVLTGIMAFALLPLLGGLRDALGTPDVQLSLVAFHTGFNLIGVIVVLPFAHQFAHLIEFLVPERGPVLTRRLDPALQVDTVAATQAAAVTVTDMADSLRATLLVRLGGRVDTPDDLPTPEALATALTDTRAFLDGIPGDADHPAERARIYHMLHILDHLGRLLYRCGQTPRIDALGHDPRLRRLRGIAAGILAQTPDPATRQTTLNRLRLLMRRQREPYRDRMVGQSRHYHITAQSLGLRLDAMRWLHRTAYHMWRIQVHLDLMAAGLAHTPPVTARNTTGGAPTS